MLARVFGLERRDDAFVRVSLNGDSEGSFRLSEHAPLLSLIQHVHERRMAVPALRPHVVHVRVARRRVPRLAPGHPGVQPVPRGGRTCLGHSHEQDICLVQVDEVAIILCDLGQSRLVEGRRRVFVMNGWAVTIVEVGIAACVKTTLVI